jgi:hypothetical protein
MLMIFSGRCFPVRESDRIQPADKIRSDSDLWTDIWIASVGIRWDPSVGIRRNLSVDFVRPLKLISSFNKLVLGANFRGRSKPPIGSVEFRQDLYEVSSDSDRIRLSDWISWVRAEFGSRNTAPVSGVMLCLVLTGSLRKRERVVTGYEHHIPASISLVFQPQEVRNLRSM